VPVTEIVEGAGPRVPAMRAADEGSDRPAPEHTVLGRSASIMEAFSGGRRVLSLAELNKRTRLPKSTLHRLLDQLCQVGWLEREHGGYRIGLRMFELGTLAEEGNRLHDAAFPHLQALASRTGLAAQLAILDRAEVVYLERVVVGPVRLPTRRGGRKPAYCTALGKAMAAYDDAAMLAVTSAPMPRKTGKTITEPVALWNELKRVREAGVAYDRGEAYAELVCVAAPVRSSGRAIAAVSVTGQPGRMRWSVATEAVRSTAAAIWNANLGLRGTDGSRRLPPGNPVTTVRGWPALPAVRPAAVAVSRPLVPASAETSTRSSRRASSRVLTRTAGPR
jgi:DNA-binding IclR family transcriptional regulator